MGTANEIEVRRTSTQLLKSNEGDDYKTSLQVLSLLAKVNTKEERWPPTQLRMHASLPLS
jgi:hypothetical protein